MGLLDQLLGLSGSNSNDWVSQMQQQMSGGPLVGPAAASSGSSMVGAQRAMPGSTPPQAGQRKMFPAPDAPKMDEGPTMRVGAAPMTEAPGVGTYLSGALRGFGGEGGGSGILGAISGAMNAGDRVTKQNDLYQTLVDGGIDPRTAQLAIKQPEALKVIQANQAKKDTERKSTELITQRLNALKTVPGMTTERALAIAQDEVAFREYMKPEGMNPDDNQPAGLLAKGFRYNRETGTMEAVPGGPADQKQVAKQQGDKTALDYTFTGMDRLASSVNALLQNDRGLGRITGAMSVLPNIPGGDAANAQAQLETLKAQVAFQTLQDMRNASKTGGALGQVTERELAMLQNALVPLEQAQSYDQFKKAMQDILKFTEESKARVRTAYDRIYNDGSGDPAALDGSALQGRGNQPFLGAGASGKSRIIGVE